MRQMRAKDDYPGINTVAQYFPLDGVLKGMNEFFGKVLGVEIAVDSLIPGESWCGEAIKTESLCQGLIQKGLYI